MTSIPKQINQRNRLQKLTKETWREADTHICGEIRIGVSSPYKPFN